MGKRNKFFIISGLVVLVFVIIIFTNPVLDKKIIPANFYLTENPGFDHAEGELRFGGIPINQSGSRKLEIYNSFDSQIKISIESSGEITPHLIVSENDFYLKQNESKDVSFTVYTTGLKEYREYSGEIIIKSSRV
jgi:hypothetical protein